MKKWMLLGALALTGCAQITQYQQAVKTPAPANLQGYWQTTGPQSGLISDRALGSLIITAQGDTLDCRQWQRVIAKPGKLTLLDGQYVNINKQLRVMPLELESDELHYDKLTLKKVDQPTLECQQALEQMSAQPDATVIQDIEPHNMRAVFAEPSAQTAQ